MEKNLPSVPGFYIAEKNGRRYWSIAGKGGLVFPVLDALGRIAALIVRLDDPPEGSGKYRYLSSKKHGGPGPGAPIHVSRFDGDKTLARVTEGVPKADIATRLTNILTIGLPGVNAWKRVARVLTEIGAKTVRVAFDADARRNRKVARCLSHLIGHLRGKGFAVELELWDEADGKGIDDLLAAGMSPGVLTDAAAIDAAVAEIVAEAEKADPTPNCAGPASGDKPQIILSTEEERVNNEAIQALSNWSKAPEIFQRGTKLVRILRARKAGKKNCFDRPEGTPSISTLPEPCLSEMLTRVAEFVKEKKCKDGKALVPAHPPDRCISAVLARGDWLKIRPLEGIIEAPTLRPDGTILDKPGRDGGTGLLYEPNVDFPPIPQAPSRGHALAAADRLLDLVAEFPFVGKDENEKYAQRAVWLAGLLTALVRFAIPGPCPLFLFDANCPGTGKSLLTDTISIAATGREMSRTAFPDDEAELRKRITSIAIAAARLMLFDNLEQGCPFGGAPSTPRWRERPGGTDFSAKMS